MAGARSRVEALASRVEAKAEVELARGGVAAKAPADIAAHVGALGMCPVEPIAGLAALSDAVSAGLA